MSLVQAYGVIIHFRAENNASCTMETRTLYHLPLKRDKWHKFHRWHKIVLFFLVLVKYHFLFTRWEFNINITDPLCFAKNKNKTFGIFLVHTDEIINEVEGLYEITEFPGIPIIILF